jgi:hypothetical protein
MGPLVAALTNTTVHSPRTRRDASIYPYIAFEGQFHLHDDQFSRIASSFKKINHWAYSKVSEQGTVKYLNFQIAASSGGWTLQLCRASKPTTLNTTQLHNRKGVDNDEQWCNDVTRRRRRSERLQNVLTRAALNLRHAGTQAGRLNVIMSMCQMDWQTSHRLVKNYKSFHERPHSERPPTIPSKCKRAATNRSDMCSRATMLIYYQCSFYVKLQVWRIMHQQVDALGVKHVDLKVCMTNCYLFINFELVLAP